MPFIDIELQSLLQTKAYYDNNPAAAGRVPGSGEGPAKDDRINLSIKFSGDIGPIEQAGFRATSVIGDVATGSIDIAGLKTLASHPQIEGLYALRRHRPLLNDSVPEIGANSVWSRSGSAFSGYTGKGVIVGIVDTGIDINHQDFQNPDGTTRIQFIWDQTLTQQGGETVPGSINIPSLAPNNTVALGYGVEYTPDQINATVKYNLDPKNNPNPGVMVRHKDDHGHGTHVAGITSGNGSRAGDCHGAFTYIGVAPDSQLIVVRSLGSTPGDKAPTSNSVLDGICYIVDRAKKNAAQAVVINISLGQITDIMDGTDPTSGPVDKILNGYTGLAVVFAAGNDGFHLYHASVTVAANPAVLSLPFTIASKDSNKRYVSLRWNTGSNLNVRLTSPGGVHIPGPTGTEWMTVTSAGAPNTTANGSGAGAQVVLTNAANQIGIEIDPPTGSPPKNPGYNVDGKWLIELQNTTATPTPLDGFCKYANDHDEQTHAFTNSSQCTSRSTLSETAAGIESISVGSYDFGFLSGHELDDFSSRGPTIETPPKTARTKPDLCAPGHSITSAGRTSEVCSCCCECCQGSYVDKGGTSMAAPHVTGTIALMLHKNPNLTHTQIKTLLTANTNPKYTGATPGETLGWGAGKLSAQKVVTAVTQVNPPVAFTAVEPEFVRPELTPPESAASLQQQWRETPNGQRLAGVFERYFPELLALVNRNKRVATSWHRCKGPVWTRLAMQAFYNPAMRVRAEVDGLSLREAVDTFLGTLKEYASAAFLREFQPFEPLVAQFAVQAAQAGGEMTIAEMIQLAGNYTIDPSWQPQPAH